MFVSRSPSAPLAFKCQLTELITVKWPIKQENLCACAMYLAIFRGLLACPLPLGLGDGRIGDEQLSASSELDDIHAAKQGRFSLTNLRESRYCAADRKARFNCYECRTKKKFTRSKKLTSGI